MTNSRYNGSQVNSPSLVISQTITSDEGRYFCLATNAVGTGQSQQTYLTVVGSTPTATVDQPQYSANKGSDITLQCSYTANPAASMVRWERDNGNTVVEIGDTTNNNKYGGSAVSSPSLIIYNAEESDEGNYKCKVTNSVGTGISPTTNLEVVGNIPIVTVTTSAYIVDVNSSITLDCQVTANPTHTSVFWQKVTGGNTETIYIHGGKYNGSSISNPSLNISDVEFSDAGTYYCYARNSVGTGSSTQVVLAVSGSCSDDQYTCLDGQCISSNYQCDSWVDCSSGEDDMGCSPCESDQFLCATDSCIKWSWVCDGMDDCGDGSDERGCSNLCWNTYNPLARRSIAKVSAKKAVSRGLNKGGKNEAAGSNLYTKKNEVEAEKIVNKLEKLRLLRRGKNGK
ncbi:Hypothetical predicted protein [Mytilus galloprovincialis]|nr:Hypothetical predicted protein [Mytilus galloprovincialis]